MKAVLLGMPRENPRQFHPDPAAEDHHLRDHQPEPHLLREFQSVAGTSLLKELGAGTRQRKDQGAGLNQVNGQEVETRLQRDQEVEHILVREAPGVDKLHQKDFLLPRQAQVGPHPWHHCKVANPSRAINPSQMTRNPSKVGGPSRMIRSPFRVTGNPFSGHRGVPRPLHDHHVHRVRFHSL